MGMGQDLRNYKFLKLYVTLIQTIYKVLFTYSLSVWQYGYVILLQTIFKAVFTSNNSELQYDYVTLLQSIFKLLFTRNKGVLQYDYVSLLQTSFQTSSYLACKYIMSKAYVET